MVDDAPAPSDVPPVASAGRRAWAALEPLHNYMYFVPLAAELYAEHGATGLANPYFAARASALGAVGPLPVVATFYNFSPFAIDRTIPALWDLISPEQAQQVRLTAVDQAVGAVLGDLADSPELHEAVALARQAAEAATQLPQGRPLFAAHAQLPWPEKPHVQLWHAQTLIREFRGDGHTATLMSRGISGLQALILYTATEKVDGDQLRLGRGWNRAEWTGAVAELQTQGLLEPGPDLEVTDAGAQLRQGIEDATDVLAQPAWESLGVEGADRLAELSLLLNKRVVAADVIPWLKKRPTVTRRSRVRGRSVTFNNLESRSAV